MTFYEQLRLHRRLRDLSVRELAKLAGCSSSLISQIEQNQISPSIKTAEKLASALGLSLADLLRTEAPTDKAILIPKDREKLEVVLEWPGAKALRLLALDVATTFTALLLRLDKNAATPVRQAPHSLKDLCVVLQGEVVCKIGTECHTLNVRDSIYLDLIYPHQWINRGDQPAEVLITSPVSFQVFDQPNRDSQSPRNSLPVLPATQQMASPL